MWLVAEGTTIEYAEQVYSITERADKKALSLLCPTRRISNRGDILNRSTLTIVSPTICAQSLPALTCPGH